MELPYSADNSPIQDKQELLAALKIARDFLLVRRRLYINSADMPAVQRRDLVQLNNELQKEGRSLGGLVAGSER